MSSDLSQNALSSEKRVFSDKLWKQKEFYLSAFITGTSREAMVAAKEAGLNLVEFAFSQSSAHVDEGIRHCDEIGLACLPYDQRRWTGVGGMQPIQDGKVINEDIIYNWISESHVHSSLIGYYLWDEVMQKDFKTAKSLKDTYKKYDPARLAYVIMYPSDAHQTWNNGPYDSDYYHYVDDFIKTLQPEIVAFDYYPLARHRCILECDWWRDMGLMRQKANEYRLPFWYYYQASELARKGDCTVPEMKVQMYAGLAYGAKYLSAYNSLGRMYRANGEKAPDFADIQTMNREVMTVGRFLFDKNDEKIYHTGLWSPSLNRIYFLDDLRGSDLIESAPEHLIISIFADKKPSARYMLVVNKDYRAANTGEIILKSERNVGLLNKTDGTIGNIGLCKGLQLNLQPGDGELYVIE